MHAGGPGGRTGGSGRKEHKPVLNSALEGAPTPLNSSEVITADVHACRLPISHPTGFVPTDLCVRICLVLTTAQYAFILKLGELFFKIHLLAVLGLHRYVGFSLQWLLLLEEKL